MFDESGARVEDTTEETEVVVSRTPIIRRATKIEWSLLMGLLFQAAALIWGAAKLSAGVDQLNHNMSTMSDYSVLRFRVEQNERAINTLQAKIENLSPRR